MSSISALPLSWFTERLRAGRAFAFARYGDGEFQCLLGQSGQNCDGVRYGAELASALAQTLSQPRGGEYQYALGPKTRTVAGVGAWLQQHSRVEHWVSTETLLAASLRGELAPLVAALRTRRVALVGGAHLVHLPVLDPLAHVVVPEATAWEHREAIRAGAEAALCAGADTLLFSAGPLSKVLIWQLAPEWGGATLLDCGSLWDLYCGKDSRRYARRMTGAQKALLLRMNFPGVR